MRAHEISISNHDIGGNEDIFDIVDIIDTDMRFFKKNCRTADRDSRDKSQLCVDIVVVVDVVDIT